MKFTQTPVEGSGSHSTGAPSADIEERTVVVEWNKLIMLAKAPDQESARTTTAAATDAASCTRKATVWPTVPLFARAFW